MSLGEDLAGALPELRAAAESMMWSTCVITREGDPVFDEESGTYPPAVVNVYMGPCRVRFASTASPREVDAQSQLLVEQEPILHLPIVGSEGVRVRDVALITDNPHDSTLRGLKFRVTGAHAQTLGTARRFPVELISEG